MSWRLYSGSIQNIMLYETNKYSPGHQPHLGEANKSPSFSRSKLHFKTTSTVKGSLGLIGPTYGNFLYQIMIRKLYARVTQFEFPAFF